MTGAASLLLALLLSAAGTTEARLPLAEALQAADRLLDAGDAAGALATLARVREEEEKEPALAMKRGTVLDLLRRHAEAQAAHRAAVAGAPGSADAFANYGVSLGLSGDVEGALVAFRRAVEIAPDHPEALANLGVTEGRLGRLTAEIEALSRAVAVSPHEAGLRFNLGVAFGRAGRATEEIEAYRAALTLRDDLAAARENLAISLLDHGEPAEAARVFERLVRDQPAKSDWLYGLGLARLRAGDLPGAESCAEELKKSDWPSASRLAERIREARRNEGNR